MNYTELKTAVEDYTENTFSATDFATMTELAEQRIYNSVQLPALRKNVTGTLTAGNQYLAAPVDFLSVFSLAVIDALGNYEYLLNKDVNFIRSSFPNPTTTGTPKYYALFGPDSSNITDLTLILGPRCTCHTRLSCCASTAAWDPSASHSAVDCVGCACVRTCVHVCACVCLGVSFL